MLFFVFLVGFFFFSIFVGGRGYVCVCVFCFYGHNFAIELQKVKVHLPEG